MYMYVTLFSQGTWEEGLWKHECLLTIDYDQVYDALPVVVKYDK